MRLSQSAVARRVVTCLLTLSLVALGGGLQWFAPQPPEAGLQGGSLTRRARRADRELCGHGRRCRCRCGDVAHTR